MREVPWGMRVLDRGVRTLGGVEGVPRKTQVPDLSTGTVGGMEGLGVVGESFEEDGTERGDVW